MYFTLDYSSKIRFALSFFILEKLPSIKNLRFFIFRYEYDQLIAAAHTNIHLRERKREKKKNNGKSAENSQSELSRTELKFWRRNFYRLWQCRRGGRDAVVVEFWPTFGRKRVPYRVLAAISGGFDLIFEASRPLKKTRKSKNENYITKLHLFYRLVIKS